MATASQLLKTLQAAMREPLRIQDHCVAEPLFARTGHDHLNREGVSIISKIKTNFRRKAAKAKCNSAGCEIRRGKLC